MEGTFRKLYDSACSLKRMPNRSRLGQKEGTRELITAPLPYIIVYGVEPDMVHIFRILPAAEERQGPGRGCFKKIGPRIPGLTFAFASTN